MKLTNGGVAVTVGVFMNHNAIALAGTEEAGDFQMEEEGELIGNESEKLIEVKYT